MFRIPIIVIALENSNRIHLLEEDCREQGIEFTLFQAIDGSQLDLQNAQELFNSDGTFARLGYEISVPLLCCALSHKAIYEKALNLDAEWLVVLEEDVRLKENFLSEIEKVIRNLSSIDPVICMLFTRGNRFVRRKSISESTPGRFIFDFASIPGQTAAYLINRKALEIATKNQILCGPPDWPNWSHQIKFTGTYPFLVEETGEQSSIGTPPMSRLSYWARNIAILTGMHFHKYRENYENLRSYTFLEVKPILSRILWKLRGSKFFPPSKKEGLWMI